MSFDSVCAPWLPHLPSQVATARATGSRPLVRIFSPGGKAVVAPVRQT